LFLIILVPGQAVYNKLNTELVQEAGIAFAPEFSSWVAHVFCKAGIAGNLGIDGMIEYSSGKLLNSEIEGEVEKRFSRTGG